MHSDIRIWTVILFYSVVGSAETVPLRADLKTLQGAGEAVAKTIQDRRHLPVTVSEVRVESAQILQGTHHRLAVEINGEPHNLLLAGEPQWQQLSDLLPSGEEDQILQPKSPICGLEALARSATLPTFTLVGPLELVFPQPQVVDLQLPHRVDAGVIQRVILDEGAAVEVSGARSVHLRRPLDLPQLPQTFLANVLGIKMPDGQVPSLGTLSGVLHIASGVWHAAKGWAISKRAARLSSLVSLQLELGPSAHLVAASPAPGEPPARLKVRRLDDSSVQLVVRDLQVQRQARSETSVRTPWAWPLPALQAGELMKYEELLRETLARQPLAPKGHLPGAVEVRLLQSMTDAVTLLQMEIELEHDWGNSSSVNWEGLEIGLPKYELVRAIVLLRGSQPTLQYIPLHAELLDSPHSTIALSHMAELAALGNVTLPDNLDFVYPSIAFHRL
eukprot:jgi/Botrbrau1/23456/Bobra.106_1s0012.1